MKTVDDYLSLNYAFVTEHLNEDGEQYWRLTVPLLPGVVAYGDSLTEATDELEAAKRIWFQTCLEKHIEIPEPVDNAYSGRVTLRMPKTLHRSLAMNADNESVSLNAYIVELLEQNSALNLLQKKE